MERVAPRATAGKTWKLQEVPVDCDAYQRLSAGKEPLLDCRRGAQAAAHNRRRQPLATIIAPIAESWRSEDSDGKHATIWDVRARRLTNLNGGKTWDKEDGQSEPKPEVARKTCVPV